MKRVVEMVFDKRQSGSSGWGKGMVQMTIVVGLIMHLLLFWLLYLHILTYYNEWDYNSTNITILCSLLNVESLIIDLLGQHSIWFSRASQTNTN